MDTIQCMYTQTLGYEKLNTHLHAGAIYRREALLLFSKAIDRDLAALVDSGTVVKIAAGIYYKPVLLPFGILPPNDNDLVKSFLRNDPFLLYSWNQYNALGLGLTQLYNQMVVYNRKRHGIFVLGNKSFSFRRPARGFPDKLTPEFLLVDLVNNIHELAEDDSLIKERIKSNWHKFNLDEIMNYVRKYGKVATQKFFEGINNYSMTP